MILKQLISCFMFWLSHCFSYDDQNLWSYMERKTLLLFYLPFTYCWKLIEQGKPISNFKNQILFRLLDHFARSLLFRLNYFINQFYNTFEILKSLIPFFSRWSRWHWRICTFTLEPAPRGPEIGFDPNQNAFYFCL